MSKTTTSTLLGTLPGLFMAVIAHAQTTPDAGALQQQMERERQGTLPQRIAPVKPAAPRDMKPVSGLVVTVKQFKLVGNTRLSNEQLAPVLAEYLHRPLDFAQLQAAAAAVGDAYRAAGWVVNVYLPEQNIKDGVVTIQIVEAFFGGTRIEGQAQRVSEQRLRQGIEAQQALGQPLNSNALDRAILLADDLPGVAVSGALRAGAREGETELVYKIADEPFVAGDLRADNMGARSTGVSRVSADVYVNSPMGQADQAVVNLILAEGSQYTKLAYTVPVGDDGWRVGANTSYLRYDLIGANGHGTSQSAGLEARYPIVRARLQNLFLSVNADQKSFDNYFNGASTTQYGMHTGSVGLAGNLFDNLGGGGANNVGLTWTNGHRNNQAGTTDASFNKLRYNVSRQQTITPDVSLYAGVDGQESRDTLDTSESFYLGGLYGVRAYPTNEGRGSSGDLAKLELRWRMDESVVFTGFYDHGRVRNRDGSPSYSLKGAGVAVAWQAGSDLNLSATLARRVGINPNPNTTTGNDQDGSLTKNRFWLAATLSY